MLVLARSLRGLHADIAAGVPAFGVSRLPGLLRIDLGNGPLEVNGLVERFLIRVVQPCAQRERVFRYCGAVLVLAQCLTAGNVRADFGLDTFGQEYAYCVGFVGHAGWPSRLGTGIHSSVSSRASSPGSRMGRRYLSAINASSPGYR